MEDQDTHPVEQADHMVGNGSSDQAQQPSEVREVAPTPASFESNGNGNSNGNGASNGNGKYAAAPVSASQEQPPTVGEIDRIRDIIFGGQQRDMDKRFKALERRAESLSNDIHDLMTSQERDRIDLDNRLSALEERVNQELQVAENRLQAQRREIYDRFSAMERQFAERLTRLERSFADQHDAIGESKLDRQDMGDLLIEAGLRLRREKLAQDGVQG